MNIRLAMAVVFVQSMYQNLSTVFALLLTPLLLRICVTVTGLMGRGRLDGAVAYVLNETVPGFPEADWKEKGMIVPIALQNGTVCMPGALPIFHIKMLLKSMSSHFMLPLVY